VIAGERFGRLSQGTGASLEHLTPRHFLVRQICIMQKAKQKAKAQPKREKRDFAQTAFSVFQQATGAKPKTQHPFQRHTRSGRGK
jgi:hypothetical protein